jgi:Arc/MetJ-type ribon-helix-helix transcriptional regulator
MSKKVRVKKNITLPIDVVEWAEEAVKGGRYAGVRSLSGLIEYLLRREMGHHREGC